MLIDRSLLLKAHVYSGRSKFEFSVPLFCHCNRPDMGEPMTKCCTCDKWYHMSCEDGHFQSTDWKCTTCNASNTIDMEQKGQTYLC